jgi:hypothetical protein
MAEESRICTAIYMCICICGCTCIYILKPPPMRSMLDVKSPRRFGTHGAHWPLQHQPRQHRRPFVRSSGGSSIGPAVPSRAPGTRRPCSRMALRCPTTADARPVQLGSRNPTKGAASPQVLFEEGDEAVIGGLDLGLRRRALADHLARGQGGRGGPECPGQRGRHNAARRGWAPALRRGANSPDANKPSKQAASTPSAAQWQGWKAMQAPSPGATMWLARLARQGL